MEEGKAVVTVAAATAEEVKEVAKVMGARMVAVVAGMAERMCEARNRCSRCRSCSPKTQLQVHRRHRHRPRKILPQRLLRCTHPCSSAAEAAATAGKEGSSVRAAAKAAAAAARAAAARAAAARGGARAAVVGLLVGGGRLQQERGRMSPPSGS
jgi:hypothetical protein